MSLTAYCDFDEIRSALGVNDLELKDTVLALPVYEMGLVRELNKISTSLNAAFSTVRQVAPGSRTTAQADLFFAVRLFSVYASAKQVGVSLANFAPKDVGDGKATVSRYSGAPFEAVLSGIDDLYTALRVELKAAHAVYLGASATIAGQSVAFIASIRGYDPVTGV